MILKFKNGQIEISDLIMEKIIEIVDSENSLYDCMGEFFQSALRKEIFLN